MANNNVRKIVTTSWDDAYKADLRVLELLNQYHLKGTFYITRDDELRSLTDEQVKEISQTQEIGAHSLDHTNLTKTSKEQALQNISQSKEYLEKLTGQPIEMFCYPDGFFNSATKAIVKQAGFLGARTIKRFSLDFPDKKDKLVMATTISVSPKVNQKENKLATLAVYFNRGIQNFFRLVEFKNKTKLSFKELSSWKTIAIKSFDYVAKNGGVFHLWGHSQTIEQYNLWPEVEEVFKYIANKDDVLYLTNSKLLKL